MLHHFKLVVMIKHVGQFSDKWKHQGVPCHLSLLGGKCPPIIDLYYFERLKLIHYQLLLN